LQFAEKDKRVNASWPDYEKELKAINVNYQDFMYKGVNHEFHNDPTARYAKEKAELSWSRTLAFFKKT